MLRLMVPLTLTVAVLTATGCEGLDDAATTDHSCSPSYVDENKFGRISAQQATPGGSIAWGVYPTKQYARYVARLYIDSRKLPSGKNQDYAPHGTVNAKDVRARAKPGSVFRIEGETYDADGVRFSYFLRCRLA
jgi:hypothetical protein